MTGIGGSGILPDHFHGSRFGLARLFPLGLAGHLCQRVKEDFFGYPHQGGALLYVNLPFDAIGDPGDAADDIPDGLCAPDRVVM